MKNKYSQDPWVISDNLGVKGQKYVPAIFVDSNRLHVECSILPEGYGFTDKQRKDSLKLAKSNAQLIATAPKLLNAAHRFLSMYESTFGEPEECEEFFELKEIIKKLTR
jgi:hypothetical protein